MTTQLIKMKQTVIEQLKNPLLIGQLAEYKGVHVNTVQRWLAENHRKLIQPDTIKFLSKRLKMQVSDMTEDN